MEPGSTLSYRVQTEQDSAPSEGESADRLVLLTSIGVAALLGVSRQYVSQLYHDDKLPRPVAWINDERPAWLPSQFGHGSFGS